MNNLRTSTEKRHVYLNEEYISKGATAFHRRGPTVDQIAMFSENYNALERLDTDHSYKLKVLDICTSDGYMGMLQILAAANILQHPIHSVYPDVR